MNDQELTDLAMRVVRSKSIAAGQAEVAERFKDPATHEDAVRFAALLLGALQQVRDVPVVRSKLLLAERRPEVVVEWLEVRK
jgi:hypothetical protein